MLFRGIRRYSDEHRSSDSDKCRKKIRFIIHLYARIVVTQLGMVYVVLFFMLSSAVHSFQFVSSFLPFVSRRSSFIHRDGQSQKGRLSILLFFIR